MISGKQIFVIGLLCFGPAFVLFKLGQQEIRQSAEFEANPEQFARQLDPGEHPPTRSDGIIHYGWSGLWTTIGTLCILYTFFVHLDVLGRKRPSASLAHGSSTVNRDRWNSKELELMDEEAGRYTPFGFQPIGYVEEKYADSTKRRAMHLSADCRRLLTISVSGKHATSTMMGVRANGVCLSLGVGPDSLTIDGLALGVPLYIRNFPEITAEQMLNEFEKLSNSTSEQHLQTLAKIDPAHASALVHYRSLLVRWFTLINGHTHETPEVVPEVNELFQMRDGMATFCWGAAEQRSLEPTAV